MERRRSGGAAVERRRSGGTPSATVAAAAVAAERRGGSLCSVAGPVEAARGPDRRSAADPAAVRGAALKSAAARVGVRAERRSPELLLPLLAPCRLRLPRTA